jgi:hypothetical protein
MINKIGVPVKNKMIASIEIIQTAISIALQTDHLGRVVPNLMDDLLAFAVTNNPETL